MPDGPASWPLQVTTSAWLPEGSVVPARSEARGADVVGRPLSRITETRLEACTGLPARSVTAPSGISNVRVPLRQPWFSTLKPDAAPPGSPKISGTVHASCVCEVPPSWTSPVPKPITGSLNVAVTLQQHELQFRTVARL